MHHQVLPLETECHDQIHPRIEPHRNQCFGPWTCLSVVVVSVDIGADFVDYFTPDVLPLFVVLFLYSLFFFLIFSLDLLLEYFWGVILFSSMGTCYLVLC